MTTDLFPVIDFRRHLRECRQCELGSDTNIPVPFRGDLNPTFAIMGEAPGKTESARNQPFVGDSGAILNHWLKNAGFDSSTITYLNACQCWPRIRPNATPLASDLKACRGWMNGQLEFIRPKVLITVGVTAFNAIRGTRKPPLSVLRAKPLMHPVYGCWVMGTYHPASYLRGRNSTYEKKITTDLARIREWWDGQEGALSECYLCGDELYNFDDWCCGLCARHAASQGVLFPEDE